MCVNTIEKIPSKSYRNTLSYAMRKNNWITEEFSLGEGNILE